MSIGIGAYANLITVDEHDAIYEYGSYNLNDPGYRNENCICDGMIMIQRECFAEPEIHEKRKRLPSGRKKSVIKRIPVTVAYEEMIEDGRITVANCSNCWRTARNDLQVDIMACRLLFKIFRLYQEEGEIPESVSYNV